MESWLKMNGYDLDQVYHPVGELRKNMEWQYQYCPGETAGWAPHI